MAVGRNSTVHPDRVPIGQAHSRIDDRVRTNAPPHRIGDADDVDPTLRPLDGHALMYDQLTGTWKPVLSPPLVTFNAFGTLAVAATGKFKCGSAGRVILGNAHLDTSGSSTTTALLKHKTGSTTTTLATYSFTSGNSDPTSEDAISFVFAQNDLLWLDVTAAGTGAKDLVLNVWATAP